MMPAAAESPTRRHAIAHNVFHVALWFTVFFAGLAGLILLRQHGFRVSAQYQAQEAISAAVSAFDRGQMREAQRQLLQLVRSQPGLALEVAAQVGPRVLGMPLFATHVGQRVASGVGLKSLDIGMARTRLILGDAQAANTILSKLETRDAKLMLARLLLAEARVPEAHEQFRAYWGRNQAERDRLVTAIHEASGTAKPELVERMLYAGLWEESARSGALLAQAMLHDVEGNAAEALDLYRRVLAEQPGHDLASRRAEALSGTAR